MRKDKQAIAYCWPPASVSYLVIIEINLIYMNGRYYCHTSLIHLNVQLYIVSTIDRKMYVHLYIGSTIGRKMYVRCEIIQY